MTNKKHQQEQEQKSDHYNSRPIWVLKESRPSQRWQCHQDDNWCYANLFSKQPCCITEISVRGIFDVLMSVRRLYIMSRYYRASDRSSFPCAMRLGSDWAAGLGCAGMISLIVNVHVGGMYTLKLKLRKATVCSFVSPTISSLVILLQHTWAGVTNILISKFNVRRNSRTKCSANFVYFHF